MFFVFAFLSCSFFVSASEFCKKPASAEINFQIDWPASPLSNYSLSEDTDPTLPKLVKYFFEWGVGLGGLGVFIALIIAGVQYITSIADPGKVKDARDRIKSSLIGLVLLLSSWAIFQLINPNLNNMAALPDIANDIIDGNLITNQDCSLSTDCCKIPDCDATACVGDPNCCVDMDCEPKNWLCCRRNDWACIEKRGTSVAFGTKDNGQKCANDAQCKEGYCGKCDRTKDPWELQCAPNPLTCIATTGKPDMGCDIVTLFDAPNFTTTANKKDVKISSTYSRWEEFDIRSYAAYAYSRNINGEMLDSAGNVTTDETLAKRVPCGKTACGCKITLCQFSTPADGECSDGGTELAWAFESHVDQSYKTVKIKDETKGVSGAINDSLDALWYIVSFDWLW